MPSLVPASVYFLHGGACDSARRRTEFGGAAVASARPDPAAPTTTTTSRPALDHGPASLARGFAASASITQQPSTSFTAASASEPSTTTSTRPPLRDTLAAAGRRALGGGVPGAAAMAVQVLTLMWLRTTVNYQYAKGMGTRAALSALYKEGGVRRFYRGVGPALVQGPLSRFGDTAANAATMSLLDAYSSTAGLPAPVKTMAASTAAGAFRIFLMPVDALKTSMQVNGSVRPLITKVRASGPGVLYHGALASAAATTAGHFPWFAVYNTANAALPQFDDLPRRLLRSAVIGFCASAVSDTVSNSIRVVKVSKQASTEAVTYPAVVRSIIAADGVSGLLTRGLKTKILANGLQGLMFSVLWRLGQDAWDKREKEKGG
jgi:hypothetical protein